MGFPRRAPAAAPVLGLAARWPSPRLVLLLEPAVDEGPYQGTGRNTASEALAAQARVDAFFEANRHRLSQGSHLRPNPTRADLYPPPTARDRRSLAFLSTQFTCSLPR